MRYYIAYKFLGSDKNELIKKLNLISSTIDKSGNTSYIFFRDNQNWGEIEIPVNQVIFKAFEEIDKSDNFLAFIDSEEKSEWLLLEAWYAKAKNKKMILIIKHNINLRFLRSIADTIIEFKSYEELGSMII